MDCPALKTKRLGCHGVFYTRHSDLDRASAPAQVHVVIGIHSSTVAAITLAIALAVGTCCPLWDFAIDGDIGEHHLSVLRHVCAASVHIDVFVHQHGIVIVSV